MIHSAPRCIVLLVAAVFSSVMFGVAQEKEKTAKKGPNPKCHAGFCGRNIQVWQATGKMQREQALLPWI